MPEAVRMVNIAETAPSNFLIALLIGALFVARRRPAAAVC